MFVPVNNGMLVQGGVVDNGMLAQGGVADNAVPFQGTGVTLFNPRSNTVPVSFVAAGQSYTLEPGYEVTLNNQPAWTVAFNRGANLGEASYQVVDGKTYGFNVTPVTGWELYEQSPTAVADAGPAPDNATPTPPPAPVNPVPVAKVAPNPTAIQTAAYSPAGTTKAVDNRPVRKGDMVSVLPATLEIKSGSKVLARVSRNQSLKVYDVKGAWLLVDGDESEYGWVLRTDVRLLDDADEAPPGVIRAPAGVRIADR